MRSTTALLLAAAALSSSSPPPRRRAAGVAAAFTASPRAGLVRSPTPEGRASASDPAASRAWMAAADVTDSEAAAAVAPRTPARAAPLRHIRMQPRSPRGDRRSFEVQTAVTTYEKVLPDGDVATVDLHAQIHCADGSYYDLYNDPESFGSRYDRVHYELVLGENLLIEDGDGTRRVRPSPDGGNPLAASPADVATAGGYGLTCQVDAVNYAQEGWVCADYTREEFVRLTAERSGRGDCAAAHDDGRPLWALASTSSAALFPLAELWGGLSRPLSPASPLSSRVTRRLFSNLFLPGDALTALMRAALWMTVPAPEASVMLLDWSSLSPRPTGGISPVALPVLECLLSGNVGEARKLAFGQMLVTGQTARVGGGVNGNGGDDDDVLVSGRNGRTLDVLRTSVERDGCRRCALLYGGAHCRGLDAGLRSMGFEPRRTEWRTAWSVDVPSFGTGAGGGRQRGRRGVGVTSSVAAPFAASASPAGLAIALVFVPLYLALGGLDWAGTIHDVAREVEYARYVDAAAEVLLYLIRHVAMYLGLAKFVVEWDGGNLFGGGGGGSGGDGRSSA